MGVLLTSFTTWLSHQKSNSADDLVEIIQQQQPSHHYLRKLPVETAAASTIAIAEIEKLQPSVVICCGMAESRTTLTLEAIANSQQSCIQTNVDLSQLISQLEHTAISYDAGKFVCEGLYYQVLKHIQINKIYIPCLFVHVPILTPANRETIVRDFQQIITFCSKSNQLSAISH